MGGDRDGFDKMSGVTQKQTYIVRSCEMKDKLDASSLHLLHGGETNLYKFPRVKILHMFAVSSLPCWLLDFVSIIHT